eukprot:246116_1
MTSLLATETVIALTTAIKQQEETKQDNTDIQKETNIPDARSLFYIYNNDKISGPFDINKIIQLWASEIIKNDLMWIKSAMKDSKWYKLEFPEYVANELGKELKDVEQECIDRNKTIKAQFPKLYEHLVHKVLDSTIFKCVAPTHIPADAKKQFSNMKSVIPILGKILSVFILFIILLEDIPSIIISTCCLFLPYGIYYIKSEEISLDTITKFTGMVFVFCNGGMVITPIVTICVILYETELYSDGIQSWMITWVVWSVLTFIITSVNVYSATLEKDKITKIVNNIVLPVVGVDLGGFTESDVFETGEWWELVVRYICQALACLVPAAIAGFIANYIFEEKFNLECGADIKNDYLCFESEYGCCHIVSSYDIANSYIFIGSLASNVLAIWAVVRIMGYLVVNAAPTIAIYAKRKK